MPALNTDNSPAMADETHLEAKYAAAVQMIVCESQLSWTVIGTFLVADTVLSAVVVGGSDESLVSVGGISLIVGGGDSPWLTRLVCLAGLATTYLWVSAVERSAAWSKFRIFQARQLEGQMKGLGVFSGDGAKFSEGKKPVDVDGVSHRPPPLARLVSMRVASVGLAAVFAAMFVAAFVKSCR
jgi:hypothetical protein